MFGQTRLIACRRHSARSFSSILPLFNCQYKRAQLKYKRYAKYSFRPPAAEIYFGKIYTGKMINDEFMPGIAKVNILFSAL